jgi:hypothetical protein
MNLAAPAQPSLPTGVATSFARLAEQGREMAALAGESNAALSARAGGVSAWAVAQQLEHLGLTGGRVLDAIEAILADPETPPRGRPNPPGWMVLLTGRIPRGRVKTRPEWSPPEASPERARQAVAALAGQIGALAARAGEIAAARATRPHPALGQLDARRWLRFLAIHQEHHLRLVRDIRAVAGLPPVTAGVAGAAVPPEPAASA